jgi:hypothetical protein
MVSRLCFSFEVVRPFEPFEWLCGVPPVMLASSGLGDSDTTAEIPHIFARDLEETKQPERC